jgi:xylan 1,4-beta-xylosidase
VRTIFVGLGMILWAAMPVLSQVVPQSVSVAVDYKETDGTLAPVWTYFGYDEPNYTYTANGKKLLGELVALSSRPVYVRVHNLLTTGDGSASLKWGSTNAYTEDAAGNPVYNWVILDRIFDTFTQVGVKPLVELGFMPEALSTHPEPYRHKFPQDSIYTGWAYPPRDYHKWSELIFQVVSHLRSRYGDAAVQSWLWEVWNEPDIGYWQGTPEEFLKLYDVSADAISRALPSARIGGPDTTGAGSAKSAAFLRLFLEHCTHEKNSVTGQTGTRLDFISFHPKGAPKWMGDHVQMGIANQLNSIEKGFDVVVSDAQWRRIPIILGEWDPEGCAACSAQQNPQNAYRNGPLYASYTAESLSRTLDLANQKNISLEGLVTWAFEFEDQPAFAGFRELATNGIDKAVLNSFRMFGLLGQERLKVKSSGALETANIVQSGVRGAADVNAMATRKSREVEVLVWSYHDDDLAAAPIAVELTIAGLPEALTRAVVEHFRIDADHSNAYAEWKAAGSPQSPSPAQYEEIQAAGQLQLLDSPSWETVRNGTTKLQFSLPRQGLSLIRLAW